MSKNQDQVVYAETKIDRYKIRYRIGKVSIMPDGSPGVFTPIPFSMVMNFIVDALDDIDTKESIQSIENLVEKNRKDLEDEYNRFLLYLHQSCSELRAESSGKVEVVS